MIGPILKEAVVLIVFCHIFVSGKDLLEIFQPSPSLPQELNEWLVSVQKHKNDFRLIREVARKNKKSHLHLEDEDDEDFNRKNYNQLTLEDDVEDQKIERSEETDPKNDIYPYMYKSNNEFETNDRKPNAKKGPVRLRRASDDAGFIEHKNFVNLEPKGKVGEIRRSDEKYPERYKESFSEERNKMKSNFKEKKETEKEVNKREVEIDIKKDGKLVKQITESESNPKSIILNIEHSQEKLNPQIAPQSPLIPNQIADANANMPGNQNAQIASNTKLPPERSVYSNNDQAKTKEFYSNFNNLFSVNEHLNTDSSIARHTGTAMGPLVYHVTIPTFVSYPEILPAYNPDVRPRPRYEENNIDPLYPNINGKPETNPYDFNHNNFQDMSKYWTANEKHQMQKGISFARNNENLRNFVQHIKFPQKIQSQTDNDTGFEPAQRIEVDNGKLIKINVAEKVEDEKGAETGVDALNYNKRNNVHKSDREGVVEIDGQKPKSLLNQCDNNIAGMNSVSNAKPDLVAKLHNAENKNTIPNFQDIAKPEKRQLQYLQGKIQLINNDKSLDDTLNKHTLLTRAGKQNIASSIIEIPKQVPLANAQPTPYTQDQVEITDISEPIDQGLESDQSGYQYVNDNPIKNHELTNAEIEILDQNSLKQNLEPKKDISEDIPRCNNLEPDSDLIEPHIRKLHTHIERDRYVTETDSEMESPELQNNAVVRERPAHVNQARGLSKLNDPRRSMRFRHNDAFNEAKKRQHSEKVDSNLKKIVIVYNNPPYAAGRRRNSKIRNYANNMAEKEPSNANEESIDQSDWGTDLDAANHRSQLVRHLPPNLIIRKRAGLDNNQALRRKRYRKNHHDSDFLGNLVSNADILKDQGPNENLDSSSEYSLVPKYVGRQLQAVEYVYDAYDKAGGDDYYEEVSTELQELASESEGRVELLQKDSVEGDYGDEEDSVTEKQKKAEFNIVKKTDNEFANPRTTTENEDDYYNDDYDNVNYCSSDKPEEKEAVVEDYTEKPKHVAMNKVSAEISDSDVSSMHHGRIGTNKFRPKMVHKHPRYLPVNANKVRIDDKDDAIVRKGARKASRSRRNRNKHPNKVYVDKMSDFQHWPTFVMDDDDNEEKLRKRSLVQRKYPNVYDFPMASKDFFVNPKRKRKVNDVKMDTTTEKIAMSTSENDVTRNIDDNGNEMKMVGMKKRETVNPIAVTRTHDVTVREADEPCSSRQVTVTNACEMDENFNKTSVEVTTILSIDQPHEGSDNDTSHGIYERLDDILDGYFPAKIVSDIFDEIGQNAKLKNRFNKGLSRSNKNLNLQNLNDTNTEETRKILDAMTCLMNRLQLTATCQVLPHNLRVYLKSITRIKKGDSLIHMKEMEEVNFDDNQNQKNFIFDSIPQGIANFQDKTQTLRELLDKFNNLPERCKTRGEPVKEYIENHLKLLNTMVEDGDSSQSNEPKAIQSRSNSQQKPEDTLIEEQLESLGLGKEHRFIPKFDLDKLIENGRHDKPAATATTTGEAQGKVHQQTANVNKRDLQSLSRSKKYNKLLDAVRKVKLKRDGDRRIAEAFGGSSDYSGFNFNSRDNEANDIAKANFESPLVYSV